jgi:hypothetical protein
MVLVSPWEESFQMRRVRSEAAEARRGKRFKECVAVIVLIFLLE